jgi:hypothetical protein
MSNWTDLPDHVRHGKRRRSEHHGRSSRRRRRKGFEGLDERFGGRSGRSHRSRRRRHRGHGDGHRRHRRGGWLKWALLGGFLLLVVGGAATADAYYYSAKTVSDIEDVADELSAAKAGLLKGHLPKGDPFTAAQAKVAAIRERLHGARPTFGVVKAIPFLGRPPVAAQELLEAVEAETRAAVGLRDLLQTALGGALDQPPDDQGGGDGGEDRVQCEDLKGEEKEQCREEREQAEQGGGDEPPAQPVGPESPLFSDGAFNLTRLKEFLPQLEAIVADLRAAEQAVLEVPTAPFIDKVEELKAEILDEVVTARELGENALDGMRFLPTLLGDGGERRYLVAFGDLSYLRGAGGSTLAIAVLSVDEGRISLSPATQVFRFFDDQVDYDVPVPEDNWYLQELPLSRRLGNANWSPHFASSASVMADLYELVASQEGIDDEPLDGVIQVDAPAVAMMMKATGPIEVPEWPEPIDARNVAEVAYVDSHLDLRGDARKDLAASLVSEAWEKIGSPRDADALLTSVMQLGKALQTKHVQIWLADEEEQTLAGRLGWDGAIRQDEGDYLYVVTDNLETDALDFFAHQTLDHDVTVTDEGSLDVVSTVTLDVELPEGDQYLAPPISNPRGTTKVTLVNLYAPESAVLSDVLRSDASGEFPLPKCAPDARENNQAGLCYREHVEQGRRVFTASMKTPLDAESFLIFRYTVPDALVQINDGPAYRLTVQAQPKMNPDELTLTVHWPQGWAIRGDPHRFEPAADGRSATLVRAVDTDFQTQLLLTGP